MMEESGHQCRRLRSAAYSAALTALMRCKGTFGYVSAKVKAMGVNATRCCKTVLPKQKSDSFLATESDSFLNTGSDIFFSILLLLPVEDLLRAQLVCRSWHKIINSSTFIKAHCTRPTPITAFYIQTSSTRDFRPFSDKEKFCASVTSILRADMIMVVSTSHGLICYIYDCYYSFYNTFAFAVGNPATQYWVDVVHDIFPHNVSDLNGTALIFDPSKSYHFKLALVFKIKSDYNSKPKKDYIRFHIYSSETCSWTVSSSVYTEIILAPTFLGDVMYHPCKIGGGSVCWKDQSYKFLVGYDISTDTFWETPLPHSPEEQYYVGVKGYNGDVYYVTIGSEEGRVWRLEEKDRWVLEGEAKNKVLKNLSDPVPFAYDKARGAILFGGRLNSEGANKDMYAFHLSSGRLELICERASLPYHGHGLFPYANTLAYRRRRRGSKRIHQLYANTWAYE